MNARTTAIVVLLVATSVVAACTTTADFEYPGDPSTTGSPTGTATGGATPTPFVVQHVISTPTSGGTVALAFPGAVKTGDVVVVTANCSATTSIASVTDTYGNTWAVAGTETFSGGEPVVVYWTKVAVGGSGFTVTVTDSAPTDSGIKALAAEIVGVSSPSHFAGAAGSGTSISSGLVTVSAGTVGFSTTVVRTATTLTALDGATLLDQGNFTLETFGDEARRASATTSMRCAFTAQPGGAWACARICFSP